MKSQNMKSLESLSWVCHLCGLFSVFIGLVVVFMSLLHSNLAQIQIGIYVFASGYAMVKIADTLSKIVLSEKCPGPDKF